MLSLRRTQGVLVGMVVTTAMCLLLATQVSGQTSTKPVFPKVTLTEGGIVLGLPAGAKKLALKQLQKSKYYLLKGHIPRDRDIRIALQFDLSNDGKDDLIVIIDNIYRGVNKPDERSEGFIFLDFNEQRGGLKKLPILQANRKASDYGYNLGDYIAYKIGDRVFFATGFFWRAMPYVGVTYLNDDGSFLEVVREQ